jgi:hypothetical protein
LFPNPGAGEYFYATLVDATYNVEIIKCTARSTDTLTIVRAQDGTTARAYITGDRLELRPVAEHFREKADKGANTDITSLTGITGAISSADSVQFDAAAGVTPGVGQVAWDSTQGTLAVGMAGGNVLARLGQALIAYVTNAEAITITKGQPVYLYQAVGDRATVKLAYNTLDATSAKTLGIVAEDIAAGQTGFIVCQGVCYKLNTAAYAAGDSLYLGATAGTVTTTKPYAPNHLVYIGTVEKANAGNGQIYVRVQNGYELDEIHDVAISSATSGNTIIYDASTSLWKNASLTAGTGISVTNGAGSITVANSGVLGVTATSPVASSGGQNPVISMPAATTSVSGYLTSTDWTTFNNKTSNTGTVTSVVATVPTGFSVSGSPITTTGTLGITYTAGYSLPTTSSQTNWDTAYTDRLNWDGGSTGLVAATGRTSLALGTIATQNANSVAITGGAIAVTADPTNALDVATKQYVDAAVANLHVHDAVQAATTAALSGTVTYANGTSGVGATLTLGTALTTLDGYTLVNGDRILIKNQATAAHNGIYTWATGGTVLTRGTPSDQVLELNGGDFFFVVNGTVNGDTGWVATQAVTTIGTSDIIFVQFSGAGTYTAGTGLSLTGSQFSVDATKLSNWDTAFSWGNHASAGYVPGARALTINGTTFDLTANRTWSVGTVTSASVVSANGFTGTVATNTTTPAITLTTSITGVLKGNGTAISAATAGTDYGAPGTASTWSASQRGTVTTDNDLSFDMSVTNNFKCTPTALGTLTFTNITSGQSGFVLLVNTGGFAISAAATTEVAAGALTTISTAGTYLLSYFSDGTNVFVTNSGALV